jgi:hypothetical protein
MKILYTISALSILNLVGIAIIASYFTPNKTVDIEITTPPSPTPVVIVKQIVKRVTRSEENSTPQATNQNSNTSQPTTAPQPIPVTSGCIITLDGAKYDVTSLRSSHSGGDIFSCNSDMSAMFWGKHGQGIFNKMQQYRI